MTEWRRLLVSIEDVIADVRATLLGDALENLRFDLGSGSGESGSGLEPMPMDKSEWIFFGLLSFCDFFVLLLMLSSLGGFIRRLIDHRTTRTGRNDSHSRLRAALATQSMTVIVRVHPSAVPAAKFSVKTAPSAASVTALPVLAPHRYRATCRMSSSS
jgi:hypothetical protein